MTTKLDATPVATQITRGNHITYVFHESFRLRTAARDYDPDTCLRKDYVFDDSYMPDLVTKECAKKMHYAAFRMEESKNARDLAHWKQKYYSLRDLIVLGNQKLVYRAVRKRMAFSYRSDDMIGEGHIVLIRAVAVFNPWIGIRFSTYAFTCLMRALSRLTQQFASDWLSKSLGMDSLSETDLRDCDEASEPGPLDGRINEFLSDDHPLLTDREKYIISCRYSLSNLSESRTLAEVGKDLGLSKERVRQVQTLALDKLRCALVGSAAE